MVCLLSMLLLSATVLAGSIMYGDIDSNGKITLRDALKLLKAEEQKETLSEEQQAAADVNADGVVGRTDMEQVFQYVIGNLADFKANQPKASGVVWIAGDSISAPRSAHDGTNPQYGWGEVLGDYLTEDAVVHNCAIGGTSSKSYTTYSNYQTIMNGLSEGDILFINFGHNDEKNDEARYTIPLADWDEEGSYKYYLKTYYIDPALEKGAVPIVVSSVVRCQQKLDKEDWQSHRYYAYSAQEITEQYKELHTYVPFVDMFHITFERYNAIGKEEALMYHAAGTGDDEYDTTHYNETGARWAAKLILSELLKQDLNFNDYIDADSFVDPRTE